jgi:hypothetical protein
MGHLNITAPTLAVVRERRDAAARLLGIAPFADAVTSLGS